MKEKIFSASHTFWNWLVVSSQNPAQVGLFVKGLTSVAAVQTLFGLLPMIGIHPSFDLNGLGDQLYTITYTGLSAVSYTAMAIGGIRKLWNTFFPPATPQV